MKEGKESIVITGCGWVTPLAAGSIAKVLTAVEASRGLKPVGRTFPPVGPTFQSVKGQAGKPVPHTACGSMSDEAFRAVPAERVNDHPDLSKELKLNKGAWMTAAALVHACRDASLQIESVAGERIGLVLGCALAGQLGMIDFANEVRQQSPRFVSPIHFPQTVGNYIAGAIARGYNIRGPSITVASGCASSLNAIIEACGVLSDGRADVVLAGGTEQLSKALAEGLTGPNVVLSEGACLFVLERSGHASARGARVLARVTASRRPQSVGPTFQSAKGQAAEPVPHTARGPGVLSLAGCRYPGAIFIEDWIGRCLGASGAAAVAAAIGAAGKCNVPILDRTNANSVSVGRVADDDIRPSNGVVPALIIADADGAHHTRLDISIEPAGA